MKKYRISAFAQIAFVFIIVVVLGMCSFRADLAYAQYEPDPDIIGTEIRRWSSNGTSCDGRLERNILRNNNSQTFYSPANVGAGIPCAGDPPPIIYIKSYDRVYINVPRLYSGYFMGPGTLEYPPYSSYPNFPNFAATVTYQLTPAPSISKVEPSRVAHSQLAENQVVTITGLNFSPTDNTVYLSNPANQYNILGTLVNPSTLRFVVPSNIVPNGYWLSVGSAFNAVLSNELVLTISKPVPVLNSISPNTVDLPLPDGGRVVSLSGTNFSSNNNYVWVKHPTDTAHRYLIGPIAGTATGLSFTLPASIVEEVYRVFVWTGESNEWSDEVVNLTVNDNTAPILHSISLAAVGYPPGSVTLSLRGEGFDPANNDILFDWPLDNRTYTFSNLGSRNMGVIGEYIDFNPSTMAEGPYRIRVRSSGSEWSNPIDFRIGSSLSLTGAGGSFTFPSSGKPFSVSGTGFSPTNNKVRFTGAGGAVFTQQNLVRDASGRINLNLPANMQVGNYAIQVLPSWGDTWSNVFNLTLTNPPVSTITSISPASTTLPLVTGTSIAIIGTNFTSTNNSVRFTHSTDAANTRTVNSNAPITTALPVVYLPTDLVAGTYSVQVNSSGGGWSNAKTLTINNYPASTITSISPATSSAPSGMRSIEIAGTNFTSTNNSVRFTHPNSANTRTVSDVIGNSTLLRIDKLPLSMATGTYAVQVNSSGRGWSNIIYMEIKDSRPGADIYLGGQGLFGEAILEKYGTLTKDSVIHLDEYLASHVVTLVTDSKEVRVPDPQIWIWISDVTDEKIQFYVLHADRIIVKPGDMYPDMSIINFEIPPGVPAGKYNVRLATLETEWSNKVPITVLPTPTNLTARLILQPEVRYGNKQGIALEWDYPTITEHAGFNISEAYGTTDTHHSKIGSTTKDINSYFIDFERSDVLRGKDILPQGTAELFSVSASLNSYYEANKSNLASITPECVKLSGNGTRRIVFVRGDQTEKLGNSIGELRDIKDAVESAKLIATAILATDPFKAFASDFSFYVDTARLDESEFQYSIMGGDYFYADPIGDVRSKSNCGSDAFAYIFLSGNPKLYYAFVPNPERNTHFEYTLSSKVVFTNLKASHPILSKTILHELGHAIAGLSDEYVVNNRAGHRHLLSDLWFNANCSPVPKQMFKSMLDNRIYAGISVGGPFGSDFYSGCDTYEFDSNGQVYYRASENSIMGSHHLSSKYNVISCGYIMAAIIGNTSTVSKQAAERHWPTCLQMDTVKANIPPQLPSPVINGVYPKTGTSDIPRSSSFLDRIKNMSSSILALVFFSNKELVNRQFVDEVTITGTGFTPTDNSVLFTSKANAANAYEINNIDSSESNTKLVFRIPSEIPNGAYWMKVGGFNTFWSATSSFTITRPGITITNENAHTPLVTSVFKGTRDLPIFAFGLSASFAPSNISEISFTMGGTGAPSRLYLYEGLTLIGSAPMPVGTSTLRIPVNIVVPKDSKRIIQVRADIINESPKTMRIQLGGYGISVGTSSPSASITGSADSGAISVTYVRPPSVVAPTTAQVFATSTITASQTYSIVPNNFRYEIDWNNDSIADDWSPSRTTYHAASSAVMSKQRAWNTTGTKTFKVRVLTAASSTSDWASRTITISNAVPTTPVITGPTVGGNFRPYSFTARSTVSGNGQLYYEFDWDNNGTADARVPSNGTVASGASTTASYTWTTTGSKTFRVRAVDTALSASAWASHVISIIDAFPSLPVITGPALGGSSRPYYFTISSTDPANGNLSYEFDWDNNGQIDARVPATGTIPSGIATTTSYTWTTTGSKTFRVRAVDTGTSASGWASKTITISNAVPTTPVITGPTTGLKNQTLSFTARSTDPRGENLTYEFDWGDSREFDESVITGHVAIAGHSWSTSGSKTFRVRAVSDITKLESAWASRTISISNTTPSVPVITGPTTGGVSRPYSFTASSTDSDGDQLYYEFDWNNALPIEARVPATGTVASGASTTTSYTWTTTGSKTFRVRAVDTGTSASAWASKTITISNAVPTTPVITGPNSAGINTAVTFTAASTDAGGDQIAYEFDWDLDGAREDRIPATGYLTSGSLGTLSHTWTSYGSKNFKVRAIDTTGLVSPWALHEMSVSNQPPSAPVITGSATGFTNQRYSFTVSSSDNDNNQLFYEFDSNSALPVDARFPSTGTNPSGTPTTAEYTWTTTGSKTFRVRAVETGNVPLMSDWTTKTINITNPVVTPVVTPVTTPVNTSASILTWTAPTSVSSARSFTYTLNWKGGVTPFTKNYKIFVHIAKADGTNVFTVASDPQIPTTQWTNNQTIASTHTLSLPSALVPKGMYTVYAGLYDPTSQERPTLIPGARVTSNVQASNGLIRYNVGTLEVR